MKNDKSTVTALALVSIGILAYELTQIRIFAFSLHPAVAYSAIALAMLGFGLGATLLTVMPGVGGGENAGKRISLLGSLLALSMVLINMLFARTSAQIIPPDTTDVDLLWTVVVLLPCIVPYLLGGLLIAVIFRSGIGRIGRLYFWNLLGSALGAIVMILLLRPLGAETLVLVGAALSAAAGLAVVLQSPGPERWMASVICVATLVLLPFSKSLFPFEPDQNGFNQAFERREVRLGFDPPVNEVTVWDPIGRIDIQKHTRTYLKVAEPIEYRVVTIDGGAMTLMLQEIGEPGTWGKAVFGESVYSSVYQLKQNPHVLVIGAGGGSDIETALYWKAKSVVGVEISLATLRAVTGRYADFVGWPNRPEVEAVHGDGRSYAKSTEKRFDIIQISGVDTMTMQTSGSAMIAAEDYLYTVDAFQDFLGILREGGILSVMRFGTQAMNLAAIAVRALRGLGVGEPQKHIAVLKQGNISGVLVKRQPFTDEQVETLAEFAAARKMRRDVSIPIYDAAGVKLGSPVSLLYPRFTAPNLTYVRFFEAARQGRERDALRALGNPVSIPTDDKPYYILGHYMEKMRTHNEIHPALKLLLAATEVIAIAALALILLPMLTVKRRSRSGALTLIRTLIYFFSIGAGFMLLEVGLIHKATVFVSTPGASVAVVLAALMVSSGIGARTSDLVSWSLVEKLLFALLGLILLSAVYRVGIGPLFDMFYGLPVWVRCIIAALTIAPAGFFMGWFFPVGLRIAESASATLVPWAIAVNGFASVLGSLATLFLGVTIGLTGVFMVALVMYIVAVVGFLKLAQRAGEGMV